MISFVVYVLFLTVADSSPTVKVNEDVGIINGDLIEIEQAPYQVALLNNGRFNCGGTIVADNIIITAAHCYTGNARYSIRAGSKIVNQGGRVVPVEKFIIHEQYNPQDTYRNDIAVLKLAERLQFSASINKVAMFSAGEQIRDGDVGTASGWGMTEKNVYPKDLRRANVYKINQQQCKKAFPGLTETSLCAGVDGKGVCNGDSGGPLLFQGKLGGVVSFGLKNRCAQKGYPDGYADVSVLRPWIDRKIYALQRDSE